MWLSFFLKQIAVKTLFISENSNASCTKIKVNFNIYNTTEYS